MPHRLRSLAALALLLASWPAVASAWNNLGHQVVADVAWHQLDAATREKIVSTLRRHPRFAPDFTEDAPTEGNQAEQDRWVFDHAATWPDQIRGNKNYDHPVWHYVDFPYFIGPERPVDFPLGTEPEGDPTKWNVMQALAFNRSVVASDALPADKAIAYCWIFHLVGDLHQPLHSTALVSENLPKGDEGGNKIMVFGGQKLHSLWDGLLGSGRTFNDVKRADFDLMQKPEWWTVDTTIDVSKWVAESHELCTSFTYCPEIIDAVKQPGRVGQPIIPSEEYLKEAGDKARQRVVAAGLRLAAVLSDSATPPAPSG